MADYKKMYTTLFNAITDALRLMEDEKFVDAAVVLATAQLRTEEMYMEERMVRMPNTEVRGSDRQTPHNQRRHPRSVLEALSVV